MHKYKDRYQAGKILAGFLNHYNKHKDAIILALPRGGVPVGYEIAKTLSLPLDVFIVRKLGFPGHEELAMGAVAMGGITFFNQTILKTEEISKEVMDSILEKEKKELRRREIKYRGDKPYYEIKNKTIILVDDGIATGASITAAIRALRQHDPASIVLAVPVAEAETCKALKSMVNDLVCPLQPVDFYAVGQWYEDFSQTTDEEVIDLLTRC